jgi:hypothetical protein
LARGTTSDLFGCDLVGSKERGHGMIIVADLVMRGREVEQKD